jgi:outer membrane protein OmpA-like peptidoglycan-associated protein
MKQRSTLFLFLLLLCGGHAQAQKNYARAHERMLDEARGAYEAHQWSEAAKIYRKLVDVDTAFADVAYELAVCLNNMPGQRERSVGYYERAVRHGHIEAMYAMALVRHRQQRFDEEVRLLNGYKQQDGRMEENVEVDRRMAMANTAKELTHDPPAMRIRNMGALINGKDHDYGPLVTADGNTMYFTSDRPGGVGGTDIWRTVRNGTTWGTPVCLGSEVNTEGDEMFPFIGKDGTFAFASDGQQGLGGLDILVGKMRPDGAVLGVKNPGAPINSGHDDFALVLDHTLLKGYFTSDRPGGKGGDDIYAMTLERPLGNSMRVEGIAFDRRTRQPMPGTVVELKDSLGNVLTSVTTGADGSYTVDLEPARNYTLAGATVGYRPAVSDLSSGPEVDTVFKQDLRLAQFADVTAWMHVTNAQTGEPLADVSAQAMDVPGGGLEVIKGSTNAAGDLRQKLEGRAIDDSLVFRVKLTKAGFFPKKGLFLYTVGQNGEVAMHQIMDLAMEPIDIGAEVGKAISINPIYFNSGKWDIRPDAATELDKVVAVLHENPTMEIELGSHTDSRGSDKANRALSDKRAKSSAAYIISKGIPKGRIKGLGYGESKLLNECGNGSECTEEQHQLNRRTEFIITRM